MSKENFAEKMKAAKAAKEAERLVAEQTKKEAETIDLKAGDEIGVEINGVEEKITLDEEQAKSLNEQINGTEIIEKVSAKVEEPIKITSSEIQVVSSEFHNFGQALFEKNKPTFLTEKVLNDLEKLPNFKALVDKGVIKIGL